MTGGTPQVKAAPRHGQNIQVYLRVRPLNSDERTQRSTSVVSVPSSREVSVQEKPLSHITKTFNFDKVFCDMSKQVDVFKSVAMPLIKQVLQGYNCTVFAYGQTGTGKTHTMEGIKEFGDPEAGVIPKEAGIIPRSLVEIFEQKRKSGFDDNSFQIKVSFLELYNEEIFDLLSKGLDPDRRYKIFEDSAKKGSVIVQGLEERVVTTENQVLRILEEGSQKRTTAATKMNASSSRSHTIFTITVTITEKSIVGQEKYIEGKLNLVDLAGSENIGRSGAVDRRAREAGKINESLLTLGRVINSLVKRETHIPYRESKLTRLLQDSLGGRTKTSIIATVSPASINVEETLSTLDYAHRAKNITNRPEVNQKIPVASKLAEMQARVDMIRRELEDQRERDGGVFISQERKEEVDKKMLELEVVRKEFRDLTELFDLKSSENEKLSEELTDTLQQLSEKSAILEATQEEKEVQEHLVSRHAATEAKIKGQALELREVADQQYSDLERLHDSKERKGKLSDHNKKVTGSFEKTSSSGLARMLELTDARAEVQDKVCAVVRTKADHVLKENEEFADKSVEQLAKTDSELKQIMTFIDSASADHMHSEQKFLSATLKKAQEGMNRQSANFQSHLTQTLSSTQSVETEVQRQQKAMETMVSQFKQHISLDSGLTSSFQSFLTQMMSAATKKQDECHLTASTLTGESNSRLDELEEKLGEQIERSHAHAEQLLKLVNDRREAEVSVFEGLKSELQTIKKNMNAAAKEHSESVTASKASFHSVTERSSAFVNEKEELSTRALGEMSDSHEAQTASLRVISRTTADLGDAEKVFVLKSQDEEKGRYDAMEAQFRERSDEAPKQLQNVQEKTRTVQKLSSDSLRDFEVNSESHKASLSRWREETLKDFDGCCKDIAEMDAKLRDEFSNTQQIQTKFFKRDLRDDVPTGLTPGRVSREYPKEIVEGTPDAERVKKYRQTRDLGAAMHLQIEADDFDDGDSVFSGSTNVTDDESRNNLSAEVMASERRQLGANKTISRQSSVEDVGIGSKAPSEVTENTENRDPHFVRPGVKAAAGSKLRAPKTYPSSSSSSAVDAKSASRTRSSSRNRNVLGSAN